MNKGIIKNFRGSWGSGIAILEIEDCKTKEIIEVPCENACTVRALDACFGDVITNGHTADGEGYKNKKIEWDWDELGLILGGFSPV